MLTIGPQRHKVKTPNNSINLRREFANGLTAEMKGRIKHDNDNFMKIREKKHEDPYNCLDLEKRIRLDPETHLSEKVLFQWDSPAEASGINCQHALINRIIKIPVLMDSKQCLL